MIAASAVITESVPLPVGETQQGYKGEQKSKNGKKKTKPRPRSREGKSTKGQAVAEYVDSIWFFPIRGSLVLTAVIVLALSVVESLNWGWVSRTGP